MNSLKIARVALRARPAAIKAPLLRRGYAEAVSDKIKLSLVLPHQVRSTYDTDNGKGIPGRFGSRADGLAALRTESIYKSQGVVQVNIPAESGEMGILANHVPSIEQLKPGLVEVIEESGSSKQFFLSGGFATVQPNSELSINAVEGFPLEDFNIENVRSQISEAQKIAGGSGSEQDIAEAKIELEVLESLQAALNGFVHHCFLNAYHGTVPLNVFSDVVIESRSFPGLAAIQFSSSDVFVLAEDLMMAAKYPRHTIPVGSISYQYDGESPVPFSTVRIRERSRDVIPRGAVASRVKLLQGFTELQPARYVSPPRRIREDSRSGFGRRVSRRFGNPAIQSAQPDEEPRVESRHSFLGLNPVRTNHEEEHALTDQTVHYSRSPGINGQIDQEDARRQYDAASPWGVLPRTISIPSVSRRGFSTGPDAMKENDSSRNHRLVMTQSSSIPSTTKKNSTRMHHHKIHPHRPKFIDSEASIATTSTIRRQNVRDLFDDYGIQRPAGLASREVSQNVDEPTCVSKESNPTSQHHPQEHPSFGASAETMGGAWFRTPSPHEHGHVHERRNSCPPSRKDSLRMANCEIEMTGAISPRTQIKTTPPESEKVAQENFTNLKQKRHSSVQDLREQLLSNREDPQKIQKDSSEQINLPAHSGVAELAQRVEQKANKDLNDHYHATRTPSIWSKGSTGSKKKNWKLKLVDWNPEGRRKAGEEHRLSDEEIVSETETKKESYKALPSVSTATNSWMDFGQSGESEKKDKGKAKENVFKRVKESGMEHNFSVNEVVMEDSLMEHEHDCVWKKMFEEVSTKNMVRNENEKRDLGILGITVLVHLARREDLVAKVESWTGGEFIAEA
ncbi:hypothetical protein IFR04_011761 [Cadophora malorum]|uniref:ATP synthase subunit delta, mitochondrial n=1 Tax=Cadophora malorum TaxID=108018 RepID=A0A8H7T9P5_9HELO|nr:hypothetical protein IFR04_011761 [Cadophora malorum]